MSDQKAQAVTPVSVTLSAGKCTATSERDSQDQASAFLPDLGNDSDVPPPAYGASYGAIDEDQNGLGTQADVTDDGRVNIRINQKTRGLSTLLVPALRSQLDLLGTKEHGPYVPPSLQTKPGATRPPPLNIVIQVVGSRGDVQPFVALGKVLKDQHGHRVRLATHPTFRDFVQESGLEFFSIAGDPAELMAFMVKNPGLMPGFDTLRSGDIGKRRHDIGNMVRRCWRSCIETGNGSGIEASDKNVEDWSRTEGSIADHSGHKPFVADAIIANPPSFAHIHCAEKLGIPLHMMFTMPWSPTQAFPHPLADIQSTNADANMTNFISYGVVDMMTWQGLGDVINRFRQKSLGLEPVSSTWAPGMLARLKIPYTYCWSPALIPKPRDWGSHISISGFYFLNLATNYTPAPDLAAFLDAGPPPMYIGFGSIVVDDPTAMTKLIFDAVKKTGQRALVSKGWGGVGADELGIPEGVFMLGNVPHDWLFKRVSVVVHHGGAGTTAAGITAGKPSVVVPFFGDQPFWGAMIARAGAGPYPIAYKDLSSDMLAKSIKQALEPATIEKAQQLADSIKFERGTEVGADSFHHQLDIDKMRCTLCPTRAAVWRMKRTEIRLSALAATVLGNEKLIRFTDLKLYRVQEHHTEDEPFDPITGATSALVGTLSSMAMGVADMPVAALKALNIHPDSKKSKPKSAASPSPSRQAGDKSRSQRKHSRTPSFVSDSSAADAKVNQPEAANQIANQMAQAAASYEQSSDSQSTATQHSTGDKVSSDMQANLKQSKDPKDMMEEAMGIGKGFFKVASAGIKSPMDFTLGLARGFHNAPKLYGDESVRKSEKITDFSSGIRVAGKEFGYGFYDGISGLVTQPFEGAKKEGAAGFIKGFGKGLGGIVLKPGAAIWGIPGYTSQGIYKELQKQFGPSVDNYIIASRTAQGYEDVRNASVEERASIVKHWKEIKPYIRKKKTFAEKQKAEVNDIRQRARSLSMRSRSRSASGTSESPSADIMLSTKKTENSPLNRTSTTDTMGTVSSGVLSPVGTLSRTPTLTSTTKSMDTNPPNYTQTKEPAPDAVTHEEEWEFDEAVRRSVKETSKGNADEDALIEKAIRMSVAELTAARSRGADDHELQQSMERSIREATQGLREDREEPVHDDLDDEDDEEDTGSERDEGLRHALAMSMAEHNERESEDEKAKREEEIVMQYMMKQSLAEEEMRQKKQQSS